MSLDGIRQSEGEVDCVVMENDVSGVYWFLVISTETFFSLCVRSFLMVVVMLLAN